MKHNNFWIKVVLLILICLFYGTGLMIGKTNDMIYSYTGFFIGLAIGSILSMVDIKMEKK